MSKKIIKSNGNLNSLEMKKISLIGLVILTLTCTCIGCKNMNTEGNTTSSGFIEIMVQNHLVSHGFDNNNKEIIEEVEVDFPTKKLISLDRIQSISEKYILTTYSFDRLVYWEYEGSYEELKEKLIGYSELKSSFQVSD
jgi:hypothetical protein